MNKLYLSAILDLCDRRIVSLVFRDTNDSVLVHETLAQALAANPDTHPLFHSDRGFRHTTRVFHDKLTTAGMTQSMSRASKCIDNGLMEGFWGIPKRERYYGRKFTSREQLSRMIREYYIVYYNFSRLQRCLGVHTSTEVYALCRRSMTDVKSSDYFTKAVLWAIEKNITSGTDGGNVSPSAPCARRQALTCTAPWGKPVVFRKPTACDP